MPRSDRVARLFEAAGTGEILTIVYDGGSQPGTKRDVTVLDVQDDGTDRAKMRALCLATGRPKLFFLDKVTIVDPDHAAPVYRAELESRPERQRERRTRRKSSGMTVTVDSRGWGKNTQPAQSQVSRWRWLWRATVALLALFGLIQLIAGVTK